MRIKSSSFKAQPRDSQAFSRVLYILSREPWDLGELVWDLVGLIELGDYLRNLLQQFLKDVLKSLVESSQVG
jgi:hypothetical protein